MKLLQDIYDFSPMMKDKGIYELLEAAELVHKGYSNFRLHIAGSVQLKIKIL